MHANDPTSRNFRDTGNRTYSGEQIAAKAALEELVRATPDLPDAPFNNFYAALYILIPDHRLAKSELARECYDYAKEGIAAIQRDKPELVENALKAQISLESDYFPAKRSLIKCANESPPNYVGMLDAARVLSAAQVVERYTGWIHAVNALFEELVSRGLEAKKLAC